MTVTAKLRLYPDDVDAKLLIKTMHAYKNACNEISAYIFDKKQLSKKKVREDFYRDIRQKYSLGAQMAQSVIDSVIAKYKAENTKGTWNEVQFKKPQADLVYNRDYSVIKGNIVSLLTLEGRVKIRFTCKGFEKYFDNTWKYGGAKVVYKKGKWYLHVSVSKEMVSTSPAAVVGVDLGINFIATAYDGKKTSFYSGRELKQKRAKYKAVRSQLQRRKTPSSRRRLKRIGNRENRYTSDVNHCVSKALVSKYSEGTMFILEDLTGIRGATEKVQRKQRYVLVSWPFYELGKFIEYKAAMNGQSVIRVDPRNTSAKCPICGAVEKSNRDKHLHIYKCKRCGYSSNDDRVGAMNLYNMGKEYLGTVM